MMSEYICPITQDIMTDPVTDEFGHTYDRQAITQWFRTSNKSPVSGQEYQNLWYLRNSNISSNPCFAGETNVTINGGWSRMDLLRKGDIVKTPEGDAKVVCVVKTLCYDSDGYRKAELCEFSMGNSTSTRLLVTPNHPILHNGKWVLPKEIKKPEWRNCKAVYSLVLDKYHIITVLGSIRAICLGHDYHSPEILEHDYFGSQRVIDDLKQMKGWSEGLVVLKSGCVVPDGNGSIKFVQ